MFNCLLVNKMLKSRFCTANYQAISDVLLYKQLNPPQYRTHTFRIDSFMGERLSKGVTVLYDVYGKGILYERLLYNNENNIILSKYSYMSNKEKQRIRKQNRKRRRQIYRKCVNVEDK